MKRQDFVSIVICCYNEALNLPVVIGAIHDNMKSCGCNYEIIAVNDGSNDETQAILDRLSSSDPRLFYLEFSRNFGHQYALKAGFDFAKGDCIICLDADMQHPPQLIPLMIKKWREGYDIVYTKRQEDPTLSKKKRFTSKLFYKFINRISDIQLENGVADFRLMDRKAANIIIDIKKGEYFFRGLVNWIGFSQYSIDYMPSQRYAGESKYTFKKMMNLAISGILSFSTKPLNIALYLGFITAFVAVLFLPYTIVSLMNGSAEAGWASIILTIAFFGGLILIILGIIGLYIGRIFNNTKDFPSYIIKSTNYEAKRKKSIA